MPAPLPAVGIRDAADSDAESCAAIYAPYVAETAISFETEPPSVDVVRRRIVAARDQHAWLVGERAGQIVGYAYGGQFNARAAYAWACEVSVYVDRDLRGGGVGRALYAALLARLTARGQRTALAGMTLPNAASHALHTRMGFEPVGTYERVGFKFDRWHDVAWMQLHLADADPPR